MLRGERSGSGLLERLPPILTGQIEVERDRFQWPVLRRRQARLAFLAPFSRSCEADPRYHLGMPHRKPHRAAPAPLYRDRWIECTPEALVIRGYYFPFAGCKVIRYRDIRSLQSFQMGVFTGRGRIWGTTNPRYRAHLNPGRPHKTVGLLLDLGRFVKPAITPDDPAPVEAILRGRPAG